MYSTFLERGKSLDILEKLIYPTGKGCVIVDIYKISNEYHATASFKGCAKAHVGYGTTKLEAIYDALTILAKHL